MISRKLLRIYCHLEAENCREKNLHGNLHSGFTSYVSRSSLILILNVIFLNLHTGYEKKFHVITF